MSGLTHILGGGHRRVAAGHFGLATLFAASLALWYTNEVASADRLADSAAVAASSANTAAAALDRGDRRTQDKKGRGAKAKRAAAREAEAARGRARKAIRKDDYPLAERLIRQGLKARKRADRDAWRLVDCELAFARKRYARSGLIAMRIVILRPKSGHVGAALYRAARAYEGLGRPRKAAELLGECVEHETTPSTLRKKAEKRLKKLTRQRPKS